MKNLEPEWKQSGYGSTESLDLGFFKIHIILRRGTKSDPIPDEERYYFTINGLASVKKFATAEAAKRIALSSALNRMNDATKLIKQMLGN
jgi:hypothetical protein